jgi:periplasmic divalent cation tolerance protein
VPTLFVTAPREAADDLARTLVEERLAACVNRVACDSVYRWDGAVHDDPETVLFVKTSEAAVETVESRIVDLHPYEVPCVERFDEADVLDAYADWRDDAVDLPDDS